MFRKTQDPKLDTLSDKIEELSKRVAELRGEKAALEDDAGVRSRIEDLERQRVEAEIELDRVKEQHTREKREIDHKIGLHRQRVEQEIELAKREQTISIREENLKADRDRFEEQMTFVRTRMEDEMKSLRSLTSEILERLPTVKVDRTIRETIGAAVNGNGNHEDDGDE